MARRKYQAAGVRAKLIAGEIVPWIERHTRSDYVKAAYFAAVSWADKEAINALYAEAEWRTKKFGVRYVVDHIVPLVRDDVCGLTVDYNLRVVLYAQNARESNHWSDRIDDLFSEPEQLCLV